MPASDFSPDAYLAKNSANAGGGGFDPDAYLAKNVETPGMFRSAVSGAAHGATLGFGDKMVAGWKSLAKGSKYADELKNEEATTGSERAANPLAYKAAEVAGGVVPAMAMPGSSVAAMARQGAVLGGLQAAGESHGDLGQTAVDSLKGAAMGGATGAVSGAIFNKALLPAIGWLGKKILPHAQAFEQGAAKVLSDQAAAPAERTAASALGTLGAATAGGSRTLERLGMTEGLPAAEAAANKAALATPDAEALATDLAAKARDKLPEQLGQIQNARTLVGQTAQDVIDARARGATTDYAKQALADRAKAQIRRYAVPTLVGAAGGAVLGDDHPGLGALSGASMGLATSRQTRALTGLLTSPESKRLVGAGFRSMAEKMVQFANTKPQLMGKFGPALMSAAQRGQDALAVAHYTMSQDPQYQELQRIAGGDE